VVKASAERNQFLGEYQTASNVDERANAREEYNTVEQSS
jgi:hypothetical protein